MLRKSLYRSPAIIGIVIAMFLWLLVPEKALAAPTGSLVGFIYGNDMKTPVEQAVVKIRNLDNGQEYVSTPTDANGAYKLENVKEGRYILGITAPDGDFNFPYIMAIKGGEIGKLSLTVQSGNVSSPAQEVKGAEKEKVSFFRTPAGVAILMVATSLALYGTFKLLEGEEEASPSKR
ncbi:MAG: carboxypeptidase-like regulatory domain-containing protein [Acidobacteriota bacterium]|nr:carboxypeptidase-like regulatory domain-containing protein [Acidobacteriota bacterium]MDW3228346.1 carboxypeptidase-like regulatory domain-containing protein [Acidobacteriota bacterium]